MIDLNKLKRKAPSSEYIGARVPEELKHALDRLTADTGVNTSALLTALLTELLKSKGYLT